MSIDLVTKITKQALDTLFLNSPFRTSMGVLLGLIFWGFSPIFSPVIKKINTEIDLEAVHIIAWIALGVFSVNLKALFTKRKISPEAENALALIEEVKKAGFTDLETKQRFRQLVQRCLDNVSLNQQALDELQKLKLKEREQ